MSHSENDLSMLSFKSASETDLYSDNGWFGAVQEISDPVASNRTSRSAKKHRPNPLFTNPLSALTVDITARIPSELHDYIIGQLNNDRAALSVCSLVCTAWLISSRYHLFHTAATIRVNRHNFRQFCDLLWTQRLNPYIGRLHLKSHNIDDNFEPGGPDFGGPTFQFNDDLQRLMGLPRIKSVRLEYHHDFKHAPLFSALAENFAGITELELVSMRFESFVHLLELLPLLRRVAVVHSAAHPSGDFASG
ncbi:hypothetical protein C8R43DRAFT_522188 [Mycena crocata]|nr:hypothetical protein C8R43DRAFT_522188 [Mycena crocata]